MNARDKAIVSDLVRFRCLSRDDIAELHFSNIKNPITQANMVLKRLRRMTSLPAPRIAGSTSIFRCQESKRTAPR